MATRKKRPGSPVPGYQAPVTGVSFQPELESMASSVVEAMYALRGRALPRLAARDAAASLGTKLSEVAQDGFAEFEAVSLVTARAMDPRLQLAVLNRRLGKKSLFTASASSNEIPVVARVMSVDRWVAHPDVLPGAVLGPSPQGGEIVTGRVRVDFIEKVRDDENILSIKAAQTLRPNLLKTVEAMSVRPDLLPAGKQPDGGAGVVVGIVDFGGDFAHDNFRNADGSTRLLGIWHQAGKAKVDSPFGYGRFYTPADINQALATPDPYAALGYGPPVDSPYDKGSHGTHVMDIAAGNGRGTGAPGVAPKADIVFVEVSASDIAWSGPQAVGQAFGDSVQMLEAVRFIFDLAGDRPCVVNVSLGTNGGPHDGTSLVEQGIDALLREKNGRAVVIAASNSQADGIHTNGTVPGYDTFDLAWTVPKARGGEMECWFDGAGRLEVTLVAPDGTEFGPVMPGDNTALTSAGQPAIFVSNRLDDPNNHMNVIGIWIAPNVMGGAWIVRLRSSVAAATEFHAWAERDDAGQSSFVTPTYTHCLGSISTGFESIAVGCYDAHKPTFPISSFSSAGPTRDGRPKPEVSAPGEAVMAAWSRTGNAVIRKSGTSMAAPAVTGLVALVHAENARQGRPPLSIAQLRQKLMSGVAGPPPAAGAWDPVYGQGRVDASAL